MSQLPQGWTKEKLSDVAEVQMGQSPKGEFVNQDGEGIPFYQGKAEFGKLYPTPKKACTKPTRIAQRNDILMSIRAPVGPTNYCPDESCIGRGLAGIRANNGLNQHYLLHYFRSIEPWMSQQGTGSTFKAISGKFLKDVEVLLAPEKDQKRIADKLDSVLTKVKAAQARLDKIPPLLKRFRQSVLVAATSGELTKDWREENEPQDWDVEILTNVIYQKWLLEREKEFERKGKKPKTNAWLKKFPSVEPYSIIDNNWIELSLENVAEVVDPNPSHRMPKYVADGMPFISSENIISIETLNFEKGKKVTEEEVEKQKTRYEINEGTFAFTRIGTIGKSVLLPNPHNYGISHAMAVVNPYDEVVDSTYLIWIMNCESILKQAKHGVQSVGVPDLGIGKMKAFRIPIPSLNEQKEIVKRLNNLFEHANTVEKKYNAAKARLDKLTQSILAKAFRGELVKSDIQKVNNEINQSNIEAAL